MAGSPPPSSTRTWWRAVGAVVAIGVVLAAAAEVVAGGLGAAARARGAGDAGPDGVRVAEIMVAARAADRFGLLYPTTAVGWRRPSPLGQPVLSRPPGTDLAVRAAFTAAGGPSRAAAHGAATVAAAAAVLALARLAWIGWGAWAAAAGAVLFALLPYTATYASHPHGGMPALAATLMALGSVLRFRKTRTRLPAAAAVAWMLVAGFCDWSAYLIIIPLAALAFGGGAVHGKVVTARPQALGLPDGLNGPLANVVSRRDGQAALALASVLGIAVAAELLFFLGWFWKNDALGAFFAALGGSAAEAATLTAAALGATPPPGPLSPALVGAPGLVVVAAWVLAAGARVVRGQPEARSVPAAALLGAGALFPLLFTSLARSSFHLPALAAGGVVLAAIDLAAVVGALVTRRRLVFARAAHEPRAAAATAVALVALAAVAAAAVPGSRRARAAGTTPDGSGARVEARAFARAVEGATEVGDKLLLLRHFAADIRFLRDVDRDAEAIPTLAGLEARRAREPHLVVLLPDPPPPDEKDHLAALLRQHPGLRIGASWLVDLRRYEPGVRSFAITAGGALVASAAEDLRLDLAYGVSPSRDALPDLGGDDGDALALARPELLAYYNLHNARGPNAERERARTQLLAGWATAPRWLDPAPRGMPAAIRWDASTRSLGLLWECPGTPLPAGVEVATARFVFKTADRASGPLAFDRPLPPACPPGAPAGELAEQSFAFKLPLRGRVRVAIQLLREGKRRQPLNPAPVELGVVGLAP